MSGAWAREADAEGEHLLGRTDLAAAAYYLTQSLATRDNGTINQSVILRRASAIIRRERKRLDPQGMTAKHGDWGDRVGDESLIWYALRAVAIAANSTPSPAWHLREAEAVLRTLHKRGRVGWAKADAER